MRKIFYLCIVLTLSGLQTLSAQTSKLVDVWEGNFTVYGATSSDDQVKRIRLRINGPQTADFLILNDAGTQYEFYYNNALYKDYNVTQTFTTTTAGATMVLVKVDKTTGLRSQEVFNIVKTQPGNSIVVLWSNNNTRYTEGKGIFGYGEFTGKGSKVYTGSKLVVGGQSLDYIKIEKVELRNDATLVTFVVTNKTSQTINGTFHQPGHPTAFYITNASRTIRYELKSADVTLPHAVSVLPSSFKKVTLFFQPLPADMKLINIFEGGSPENTNLWKFYDLLLKD